MSKSLNVIIACGGTGGHLFPGIAVAQQLRSMGHNPVLLISQKKVDAEAAGKYGDLKFHTIQAIAKPPTLSLRMPAFLWKLAAMVRAAATICWVPVPWVPPSPLRKPLRQVR